MFFNRLLFFFKKLTKKCCCFANKITIIHTHTHTNDIHIFCCRFTESTRISYTGFQCHHYLYKSHLTRTRHQSIHLNYAESTECFTKK